ncbi:MAG TPA: dephospho-CoA kinase [Terriglobales bacterium]|nr:dephospho-CoA kinase [Terriglobales bacterium]
MLRVGLTGGIACGKTVVGQMFAARGAHVIQADRIAHDLMQPGGAVYSQVVRHFGRQILQPDGRIDRQKLAEAAFGQSGAGEGSGGPGRVDELNRIVHPAVIASQEEWMADIQRRDPHGIAMVEAALLVEAGVARRFDKIIVVTCSREARLQRLAQRLQVDEETARQEMERRMAAQMPDEEKARHADYVIENSGSLAEAEQQVDKIMQELRKAAV